MVLPASDKIPRVSSVLRILLASASFCLPGSRRLWHRASHHIRLFFASALSQLLQPHISMVWAFPLSARRYFGESLLFSFPPGTWMFRFPGTLTFQDGILLSDAGFPHSDTGASSLPYSSAPLFAVRCVLLQLRWQGILPYALVSLISLFSFSSFLMLVFEISSFYELFFCFQCHLFHNLL